MGNKKTMKSFISSMVAASALMISSGAWAEEMPGLTKSHDCDICHDIEKRLVAPSWREISKRYKGATKYVYGGKEYPLVDGLVMAVSRGTTGENWKGMPMPANDPDGKKQTDMQGLVRYMLNLEN